MDTTGISGLPALKNSQKNITQSKGSERMEKNRSDVNKTLESVTEGMQQKLADVKETAARLQEISDTLGKKLSFNVNEELGEVVVKVIDPSTDKVIKEIPSVELQQLQIQIKETIGILFDETV